MNETSSSGSDSTHNEATSPELQPAANAANLDEQLRVYPEASWLDEDRRILKEYTWASYKSLPLVMKHAMEPAVLKSLLQDSSVVSYDTCSTCLRTNEGVRALLLEGWEKGTFRALRNTPTFLSLCNPVDQNTGGTSNEAPENASCGASVDVATTTERDLGGQNNGEEGERLAIECQSTSEVVQTDKEVNIYGGNVYNVAGDVWRVTYSDYDHSIAEWFFHIDYRVTHNEISKKRSKNTGGWLLRSMTYREWYASPQPRTMWCPGIPGVGKTVMTSLIVDHLRTFDESQTFVAAIYFNYKLRNQQSKRAILEALCRQMFEFRQQLTFRDLYKSHSKRKSRPTEAELRSALSAAFQDYQHCYLVLDALDEFTAHYSDKQVREIIEIILSLGGNVKLLVTSRVLGEMKATFAELGASRKEIIADDSDMRTYLAERIESLRSKLDFELSDAFSTLVVDKVVEAAKGRFLVAELGMNLLAEQLNLGDLEDALENLPNGIDETYIRVMELIRHYSGPQRELAMNALMWVAYARRPLSVRELQHALATKHGKKETHKYCTPLSTITSLCAGLIVVQDKRWYHVYNDERIVRFVHFTTQEFFEKFQPNYFSDAHKQMCSTCIEYLTITGNHILPADCDWRNYRWAPDQEVLLPFYSYAARNWGAHARANNELPPGAFEFLQRNDQPVLLSCNYILATSDDAITGKDWPNIFLAVYHAQTNSLSVLLDRTNDIPRTALHRTPMHIAGIFGRANAMEQMLHRWRSSRINNDLARTDNPEGSRPENSRDARGKTPISYAATCGHEATVKLLMKHRHIEVDLKDHRGRTPFSLVVQQGKESMLRLFLEHGGVEVDSKDNDGRTPFSYAVQRCFEAIMKLLLDHEVDVHSKANNGRTIFSYAAEGGSASLIQLLLKHGGVEVDLKDNYGLTPFSYAAWWGRESVLKLLLLHGGVDLNSKDNRGRTPFSYAAEKGYDTILKLLVQHGSVEVDSKDNDCRTALSYAAHWGHASTVQFLLNHGAMEVHSRDKFGRSPFSYAAAILSEETMKLLYEHEAVDIDLKDDSGRTPFGYAAQSGSVTVLRFLLAYGDINVDSKDSNGRTPLTYAIRFCQIPVVKFLLEYGGVDVDSKDNDGRTPFSHAAERCSRPVLQLLLYHGGIQANTQDNDGRSALSWASGGTARPVAQNLEAIQLILAQGVDVNLPDNKGRTALYYARQALNIRGVFHQRIVDLLEANGAVELPIEGAGLNGGNAHM